MKDTERRKKRARAIRSGVRNDLLYVLGHAADEHILDHAFEDCEDGAELKIADAEIRRVMRAIRAMEAL